MKYKLLGRSGLKVSELCLGTMGFGTEAGWGADKETSFAIMDAFAEAGGNFVDTANMYKVGTSEKIIGEYLGNHDRDYFVVATKYSLKDNFTNPNASGGETWISATSNGSARLTSKLSISLRKIGV